MLSEIIKCFANGKILYTSHARKEMIEEEFGKIKEHEVVEAIYTGEIIEEYLDDKPYPSVLIFGKSRNKPIHIVCVYSDEENIAIIITVYRPNPDRWNGYRRRI